MRLIQLAILIIALLNIWACGDAPEAGFTMEVSGEQAPVTVQCKNSSQNAEAYIWDFGDGQTSTDANPSHTYDYWGKFAVKLTAIKGANSTTTVDTITIEEPPKRVVEMVTDMGTMRIELSNLTPQHRDNFIKLAKDGFYDNLLFHRVIEGFMLQGGDPDSHNAAPNQRLGQGGPGYTIPAEFRSGMYHYKGALAAARLGGGINPQKESSGSQFYIVHGNPVQPALLNKQEQRFNFVYNQAERNHYAKVGGAPFLDMDYTVFGYVTDGFDVIDAIATQPVMNNNPDRPVKDIHIQKINIIL